MVLWQSWLSTSSSYLSSAGKPSNSKQERGRQDKAHVPVVIELWANNLHDHFAQLNGLIPK